MPLVIDDLMGEKNKTVTKFFMVCSHHLSLTIFYLVQNLFLKSNLTISLNSQIVVLFKNRRDMGQMSVFFRQSYPQHIKEICKAFLDTTSKLYKYLLFDFCSVIPDQPQIQTGIFPEELQFVYVST